ncbi:MAG: site-specific integrase [Oscillospiraceae bacterium]|jgi:integrase|nr:site-specific integrase [Oscillospiraceae bacterium]
MNLSKNTSALDWANQWLTTYVQPSRAEKTYKSYQTVLNIVKREFPELNHLLLQDMNGLYAQKIINQLANQYSKSTLNSLRTIFHESSEVASEIPTFHAQAIGKLSIPKNASQKTVRALTRIEQQTVEEAARHTYLGYIALFYLRTGLRAEELCHLEWRDFNRKERTIFIWKSKTPAGIRYVPLRKEAMQIILIQPKSSRDDSIFHSERYGTPITASVLHKLYLRLRRETGVNFLTTHVYRHTFATRALENGMNVKALSRILGHENVAFTMQRYCSPDTKFLQEQMDMLDSTNNSF